jgi:hypothetical protein
LHLISGSFGLQSRTVLAACAGFNVPQRVFLFSFHKYSLAAFRAGHSHGFSRKQVTFHLGSRGTGVTFAMLLSMLSWRAGRSAGFVLSSRQSSNSSIKATTVEELASYQASMSVAPYFGC